MTDEAAIYIEVAKFKDRVPAVDDEQIFHESDVLKFLIDQMNAAGVDITMIDYDHEIGIEYRGRRDYFNIGLGSMDTPENAMIAGIAELSYMLNYHDEIESWTSYKNGKHFLHFLHIVEKPEPAEPEPAEPAEVIA